MRNSFTSVALAVAWRNLHTFFSSPALILPGLLFPLFFFTAFAGGLSSISNVPGFDYPDGYATFQWVFVLLQSAAFGGVFTGFSIARDFESKFARRFLLAARRRSGITAGYALAALVRWIFTASVVTVVAVIAGITVSGTPGELFAVVLLAFLLNAAALLWAAGIAMRFRTVQAGPLMQMPVFLALFLAPVYVPLALLTGWIHTVARYVGLAFILGFALVGAFLIWARRGLRSAEAAGA
jgi:ABC-2 type transport system permease protein